MCRKVSIIIPVYNVEQYLRQCLDSVINQTFKNIEIIAVNDCSTDNSLQIIKEYQQKDKRIVLVDLKQNVGLGFARNEGIKIAKGKYITFVDSDDWIASNFIEILYNEITKNNTDFVSAGYYMFDDITNEQTIGNKDIQINYNTVFNKRKDKEFFLKNLRHTLICVVWNKIFRKDFLFSNNIFFKVKKLEDNIFLYESFLYASSFVFIEENIYFYRVNRINSLVNTINIEDISVFWDKFLSVTKIKFKQYKAYSYTYISLHAMGIMEKLTLKQSKLVFSKFRNLFFNKDFIPDYSYVYGIKTKINLFVFYICLKYNINYGVIVKSLIHPLRLLKRK